VVEFGLALPDRFKVEGRSGKVFLRRWAEQFLPKDHLWSKKKGFTVPVGAWLKGERMVQLVNSCVEHPALSVLHAQGLAQLLERQAKLGAETAFVWALLGYGLWFEQFIGTGENPLHHWVSGDKSGFTGLR
jgi:asparagine synthase (glutamine-hydrolysing)